MTSKTRIAMLCGGALALLVSGAALATTGESDPKKAATPSSWGYEMKDGKRVPKAERTTNADGSWKEVSKKGNCTTTKEKSASGELKVTRSCD